MGKKRGGKMEEGAHRRQCGRIRSLRGHEDSIISKGSRWRTRGKGRGREGTPKAEEWEKEKGGRDGGEEGRKEKECGVEPKDEVEGAFKKEEEKEERRREK